jgi:hypothetical protein
MEKGTEMRKAFISIGRSWESHKKIYLAAFLSRAVQGTSADPDYVTGASSDS